jgi:hypothetical protein
VVRAPVDSSDNRSFDMVLFRIVLLALWVILWGLTIRASMLLGVAASSVYLSDFHQPWRAMLNSDFAVHLLMAGLWILYRERSALTGILCAIGAVLLGMPFTLMYLVVTTFREKGDMRRVLLGRHFTA